MSWRHGPVGPGWRCCSSSWAMPEVADWLTQTWAFFLIASLVNVAGAAVHGVLASQGVCQGDRSESHGFWVSPVRWSSCSLLTFTPLSAMGSSRAWNNLATPIRLGSTTRAFWPRQGAPWRAAGKLLPSTWNWVRHLWGLWLPARGCLPTATASPSSPARSSARQEHHPGQPVCRPGPGYLYAVAGDASCTGPSVFQFPERTTPLWTRHWRGELAGYAAAPGRTHFGRAGRGGHQNPTLVILMAGSFILFNLWWVALYLPGLPPHPVRLGDGPHGARGGSPTSNPRWASPVKNHILCFILGRDRHPALRACGKSR